MSTATKSDVKFQSAAAPKEEKVSGGPVVGMVTTIKDPQNGGRVEFNVATCSFLADFNGATEASTTTVTRTTKPTAAQYAAAVEEGKDIDALMRALKSGRSVSFACVHGWSVNAGSGGIREETKINANGTTSISIFFDPQGDRSDFSV